MFLGDGASSPGDSGRRRSAFRSEASQHSAVNPIGLAEMITKGFECFGVVALKIAAMDHLFHPILEFKNQSWNDIGLALTIFFCILVLLIS